LAPPERVTISLPVNERFVPVPASISIVIHFYTKPGCPLCDEAELLLEAAAHHYEVSVTKFNILANPALYEEYSRRIPVLIIGARTLEPPIREDQLAEAIRDAASRAARTT
jgi:thiol-disulfide isomerase/thioredoxin